MTWVSTKSAFSIERKPGEIWVGLRTGCETLYWKGVPWSCWYLEIQPLPALRLSWWGPNAYGAEEDDDLG